MENDDLTGLPTRRPFFACLDRALAAAAAGGPPLCLLVIDLDYLKSINDHFGHQRGDQALYAAAQAITGQLRSGDFAARYGGDEFVVVCERTPLQGGLAAAERILAAAAQASPAAQPGAARLQLSLSIGVAAYPEHGTDGESLFAAADRGLYAAKTAGRGCARTGTLAETP